MDELHRWDYPAAGAEAGGWSYFQRVAMMNAAAMPPMPIRMFQFPRSLMYGMFGPAT